MSIANNHPKSRFGLDPAVWERFTGLLGRYSDAEEHIELAHEAIKRAKEAKKEAKKQIAEYVATMLSLIDDPDERISLASEFYWDWDDEVPVNAIASGLSVRAHQLPGLMPKRWFVSCKRCGQSMPVESRSEMQERRRGAGWRSEECNDCRERDRDRWEQKQAEQERVIDELRALPYREYLKTDHWQSVRVAALKRARFSCQLCNASGVTLDVHHRTYDHLGYEFAVDVIVLCRDCHTRHHDRLRKP